MSKTGRSFALGISLAVAGTAIAGGVVSVAFNIYYNGTIIGGNGALSTSNANSGLGVIWDGGYLLLAARGATSKGTYGQVQYSDGDGGIGNATRFYIDDAGYPGLVTSSATLTTPSANTISLSSRQYATQSTLAVNVAGEPENIVQEFIPNGWPAIANFSQGVLQPSGDGNVWGMYWATVGTALSSDSYGRNIPRGSPGVTYRNTTSASFQAASVYGQRMFWRGNGQNLGGWFAVQDWAITSHPPDDEAVFVGLYYRDTAITGGSSPSALLHTVFAGIDSAETVYKLCANGGTGTASCTSCGANFPAGVLSPTYTAFRLITYAPPSSASVYAELRRLDSPSTAPCTATFPLASGKYPANNLFLAPHFWASTASSASGTIFMRVLKFYGVAF